ncbi:MAG: alpha/beta fold hydrolase [Pseudomonadota bacterium]
MLIRRPDQPGEIRSLSGLVRGGGLCTVVLVSLLIMGLQSAPARAENPNVALPTLGGTQFWADEHLRNGWRIQRHVWTGHYRLLDSDNVRLAWGSYAHCLEKLGESRVPRPQSRHLVLLVHGIGRGPGTFGDLPGILRKAGFEAHAISYPSIRGSIEAHATQLEKLLQRLRHVDEVSFVTHSMGGIIVRQLLARDGAWKSSIRPGRIVMIAPPNQGSLTAQTLQPAWPYKLVYGAAGQQLTPEKVMKRPVPAIPFGIIAGGLGDGEGYNPLLPGDDDGTVAVAETRLEGAADFMVLPGLHGFVARSQEIELLVLNFLSSGHFNPARSRHDG